MIRDQMVSIQLRSGSVGSVGFSRWPRPCSLGLSIRMLIPLFTEQDVALGTNRVAIQLLSLSGLRIEVHALKFQQRGNKAPVVRGELLELLTDGVYLAPTERLN